MRSIAIGTVAHGDVDVLLGKKDAKASWLHYNSPLRWILFGGKIEAGETPKRAFIREMEEEVGIIPDEDATELVGIIFLTKKHLRNGTSSHLRMHVFLARKWSGLPRRTSEIEGWRWSNQRALPHYAMLAADPGWMPSIFKGKKIIARVVTDHVQRHLLAPIIIREVASFGPSLA